jgi:hypothetical protein
MDARNIALNAKYVRLPGRAGEFQQSGSMGQLVREVGDNYGQYHAHLNGMMAAARGRLRPEDHDDRESFLQAYALAQEVVLMEAFLRNARVSRRSGTPLDAGLDLGTPLLDSENRLVSVE